MTSPSVVDKQLIDINLQGGLDRSQNEEAVDWTKRLTEANNVSVDGESLIVRPGLASIIDPSTTGTFQAFSRMGETDAGLVGLDRANLYQMVESSPNSFQPRQIEYLPIGEFNSGVIGKGTFYAMSGCANFTRYRCFFAGGDSISIPGKYQIVICDSQSGNIIKRYFLQPSISGGAVFGMVGVSDRYLHIFKYETGDIPKVAIIDTNSLTSSSSGITFSAIDIAKSEISDTIEAISKGPSFSCVCVKCPSGKRFISVIGPTGTVTASQYITGFNTVTDIDATSGTLFVAGILSDLSAKNLTGWWRIAFSASPWNGTASVGISGTRSISEGVNPPTAGAALNGFNTASFDGVNDRIRDTANSIDTYISNGSGTVVALFKASAAAADPGAGGRYASPGFFMHDSIGNFYFGFNSAGVFLGGWNGAAHNSLAIACSTGAWHMVVGTWNATTFSLSLDAGSFSTLAHTLSLGGAGGLAVGTNYNSSAFYNGLIAEVISNQSTSTASDVQDYRNYFNSRYGTSF